MIYTAVLVLLVLLALSIPVAAVLGMLGLVLDHQYSIQEAVLRVPLVVRGPGFEPGRSGTPVSTADLFPTLLQLSDLLFAGQHAGGGIGTALETDPAAGD